MTTSENGVIINKRIVYFQIALLSISLIAVIFLIIKNVEFSKQINELNKFNKELSKNIELDTKKEMARLFENISGYTQKEIGTKMQELKDISMENFSNSLTDISEKLEGKISNTNNELTKLTKELEHSINSTIELANSRIIRNEKSAALASETAQKYIESENYDVAKIYLINAINHNPQKIEYISELFKLFQIHYTSNEDVLNQIRSIVELSLYQLEPQDIDQDIKYLSLLDDAKQKIILATSSKNQEEEIDWAIKYNLIIGEDLNNISTDPEQLHKRLEKLINILSNIKNNEEKYEKLIDLVEKEIEKEKNIYSLSTVAQEVNNYIDLLSNEKDYSSQTASSRLLAASKSMSVFWAYNIDNLPAKLKHLIISELPNKMKLYEQKISKAKSLPYFEKATQIITEATNYFSEKKQNMINHNQKALEEVIHLAQNITDQTLREKIHENIKILQEKNRTLKREQYIAYQKWAADTCSNVFHEKISINLFTDDDAKRIFYQSDLNLIDLRLTSPEVSQVYNKIIQQILGELPATDAFQIQETLMRSNKKTLGDF